MDWFIIAIISAFLSAISAVLQKKVLFNSDVEFFTVIVSLFGFLIALPLIGFIDFSRLNLLSLLVLFGKSVLGALAFYFVMKAIKNLEISAALPLMVLSPGLVAIFAFLLLGETLSLSEILGMVLLLAGTYFLELRNIKDLLRPFTIYSNSKNHFYIFYALILFTITSISDKWLLSKFKVEVNAFILFQQLFFLIIFLLFYLFKSRGIYTFSRNINKKLLFYIFLISILTLGYRYTQIEAFRIAPIALVLSLKRVSVFFAAIGGGKVFKEKNLLIKTIATIVMILGAIIIAKE